MWSDCVKIVIDIVTKNLAKNSKSKSAALIVGAVGTAIATGVGGYATGVFTTQDVQDFEPIYTVSVQELKSAKSTLNSLLIRSNTTNIPDYNSQVMPEWYDADNDGCPTRYDILTRDILNEKVDEINCKVKSGTMFDYYTGTLVKYNRLVNGGGIDVDHIVAKGNAWISGGYTWSNDQWKTYVNDEDVLMATSARVNRSKGDKDASEWLPSNEKFWCRYVIYQVNIKNKYGLSVSTDEKSTIENILNTNCNRNWED
ncbi:hypothetical protein IJ076_02905 [Candidatus Saccharibacteria bacterium]|nr:hypothetical protein [Candidatus Saccharibacteria bacterium]